MQDGLWKKQLITSFVKYFIESHQNTICIGFQVYNPKLSQGGVFKMYAYYKRLCTGCSTKEAIEALYRKWWKYYMHCFQFHNQKLS